MISAVKRKELRGVLVRFLSDIYPEGISRESIWETFYDHYRTEDIAEELEYLVDKGYAQHSESRTPFNTFNVIHNYKLTAKGKDLLDGTIEDKGVFVKEA